MIPPDTWMVEVVICISIYHLIYESDKALFPYQNHFVTIVSRSQGGYFLILALDEVQGSLEKLVPTQTQVAQQ